MTNNLLSPVVPAYFDTERLRMRAPRPGDGVIVYEAICESLDALRRFPASLPWTVGKQSVESSEAFCRKGAQDFAEGKDFPFLVTSQQTGKLIGCAGVHRIDRSVPKCEIGYWCRSTMVGQGYITEAVQGLVRTAIQHLGVERIEIITDDENRRAWRVCERAGFVLEGIHRRERRAPDGTLRNSRVYAFLSAEGHNSVLDADAQVRRSM
jgi:RimJ/RimL family protein N-acetyltransferase